jgi:hypothetical protein
MLGVGGYGFIPLAGALPERHRFECRRRGAEPQEVYP